MSFHEVMGLGMPEQIPPTEVSQTRYHNRLPARLEVLASPADGIVDLADENIAELTGQQRQVEAVDGRSGAVSKAVSCAPPAPARWSPCSPSTPPRTFPHPSRSASSADALQEPESSRRTAYTEDPLTAVQCLYSSQKNNVRGHIIKAAKFTNLLREPRRLSLGSHPSEVDEQVLGVMCPGSHGVGLLDSRRSRGLSSV